MGPSSQGMSEVYQTFMTVLLKFPNDQCCGTISDYGATLVKLLITDDQESRVYVSPSKLCVPDIPLTADRDISSYRQVYHYTVHYQRRKLELL